MRLVTTEHMRHLEQAAVDAGSTWVGLMEQAGWGVAQEALRLLGDARDRQVVVLVGPGNNGGDGLVAARHLHDAGARVVLYIWKRQPAHHDSNWQRCRDRHLSEVAADQDSASGYRRLHELLEQADLVIDALLGMGQNRPVSGELAEIVNAVNATRTASGQHPYKVLAVDMPTGVQSDTGAILETAIRADVTVATGLSKRGLFLYPGRGVAGDITVVDIGISPHDLEIIMSETLNKKQVAGLLPSRPQDSHKGTFGKVMVVAGSLHYPGAAALATGGACRVGAGLVTLATGRTILGLSGRGPEVTLLPLREAEWGTIGPDAAEDIFKYLEQSEGYRALLIGPGLGKEEPTSKFLQRLLGLEETRQKSRVGFRVHPETDEPVKESQQPERTLPPLVLDADSLNILAEMENWPTYLPREQCILTPHPGEMRRLLGVDSLGGDLVQVATDAAKQWKQVVVLKGSTTVIAAPGGRSLVHAAANPALATAGTGDVLAGCIAGLLAQGMQLFDAATLGVYLHSTAGAKMQEELGDAGTLASDLLAHLPRVLKELSGR